MHHASSLALPAGAQVPGRPLSRPPDPEIGTGIHSRTDLLQAGLSDSRIRTLIEHGTLTRLSRGWFATAAADPVERRALAAGTRITCVDALRRRGVWIPPDVARAGLHAYRPRTAEHFPTGFIAHGKGTRCWPESGPVASVELALAHALSCLDAETAAILAESAMHLGLVDPVVVQQMLDAAPWHTRHRVGTLSTASDSGSETRTVRWLRSRTFRVEQQPYVEGVGFLDAYVAGVFLEIDGREHHSSPDAFERDRRRDLGMRRLGLQVLRLSYDQVWRRWPQTRGALLESIRLLGPAGKRAVSRLAGDRR